MSCRVNNWQIKPISSHVNCQNQSGWVTICNRVPDTENLRSPTTQRPQTVGAITLGWQRAPPEHINRDATRRGPHIDALTASFNCHVTGDDPRGCQAGLTGFEVATRRLSGLANICCRVWLVEATFIFVSVRSAWFYLAFSQEHHVIADMLLAFCTRSCNPSN